MARALLLLLVSLVFVGCDRLPGIRQAAVHVDVSYDFNAGCLVVVGRDKAAPEKEDREETGVLGRAPKEGSRREADFAVYRGEGWGRTIQITVTAHEQTCDGPEVARQEAEFTLKEAGTQALSVTLSAPDEDGDGWVAESAGGRDCEDKQAESNPGVTGEVCDGWDNDCRNGIDDGLPRFDFFLDGDGDGVGAGPAVQDCRAPANHVTVSGDCDDGDNARAPNKVEVCDDLDNDCNVLVDDGLATSPYYRDADGDGFGTQDNVAQKCRAPEGYVAATASFDCNDSNPAVKPEAAELCNDVDDDCDTSTDEDFPLKNTVCTNSLCSGQYVCNAAQNATECNAPAPVSYYPDADADTEGDAGAMAQEVCPGTPSPAGKVANNTDCDDSDPHNRSGGTEVCDDRDNNCSGGNDEENVCGGKGWRVLTDLVTKAHNWNTVAVRGPGGAVWIAGEAGALAVRPAGATSFSERHQECGDIRWNAVWVRPSDGHVFLAGDGGNLATYNGVECTVVNTENATGGMTSIRALLGIVGFESGSTVYAVSDHGHVFSWTPGNEPVYKTKRSSNDPYRDIHGTGLSRMLLVGVNNPNDRPEIRGYNGETTRTLHTFTGVPTSSADSLNGVWAWGDTSAYAVGKKGTLLRRTGETTWVYASPNATMQVDLNSVVAFDDSSVYVAANDGRILRPVPGAWGVHYNVSAPLKDIAATSRQDIWAVGHGFVVHFPE